MNSVIASLQQRFEVLNSYNEILTSSQLSETVLLNHCLKLDKALTQTYENKEENDVDVSGKDLLMEIKSFGKVLAHETSPQETLEQLYDLQLQQSFPNLCVAFKILLMIPVSVATCERSFSTLKLIKTYLCSTTSQERLNGLAVISINHKVAKKS